jgi:His/Glu/Gln/Arg/opine family amino acid ABC transporter permease subunit
MTTENVLTLLLFGFPPPPEMLDPRFPLSLQRSGGLLLTLIITVLSLIVGAGIGTILALSRRDRAGNLRLISRAPAYVAVVIIEVVRGLPIMLLVLLVFYLPYRLIEVRVPSVVLAVFAFSLYAGVYLSEILRAGFRSVDPGLSQVGRLLGLSPRQILMRIELPLVCRTMLPDLINLAVTVLKDTSTLAIVAVPELTYAARQLLTSKPMQYELAMLGVLALYWAPATFLTALAFRADRRRAALGDHS